MSQLTDNYIPNDLFRRIQVLGFFWGKLEAKYKEAIEWMKDREIEVSVIENEDGTWSAKSNSCDGKYNLVRNNYKTEQEALYSAVNLSASIYHVMYDDDYFFNYD